MAYQRLVALDICGWWAVLHLKLVLFWRFFMAILAPGQCLQVGQSLRSQNQQYTLILQTDGNVLLYNPYSQPLWVTDTGGLIAPGHFAMQTDGNLVLYDVNGVPKWASQTANQPGAFLDV
jgi:hypothetical protein